jgi:predicted flap endonuclease-1-like 5' DNA nuclease
MSYLILQMLFCLIIAAILGFIIGWLLRGISIKQRELELTEECDKRIRGLKILPASEIEKQKTAVFEEHSNTVSTKSSNLAGTENTHVAGTQSSTATATGNTNVSDTKSSNLTGAGSATNVANTVSAESKTSEVSLSQYDIEDIEGIGQGRGNALRGLGISTIQLLFDNFRQADGNRGKLASKLKIEEDIVRQWVSMADLMRIPGVGSQYSELLEASGVHSVPDLANQDALSLAEKMQQTNKAQHITVITLPGTSEVSSWITIAKSLPPKLTL